MSRSLNLFFRQLNKQNEPFADIKQTDDKALVLLLLLCIMTV